MKQMIKISVDKQGDLHVDLSGYTGESCRFEEAELRRMLAELGIKAEIKNCKSKTQQLQRTVPSPIKPLNIRKVKI